MRIYRTYFVVVVAFLLYSCKSNKQFIEENKTNYGYIKFYLEKRDKKSKSIERVYAVVDSSGYRSYYNFFPDRIQRTTEISKNMIYTAFYGELPKKYSNKEFVNFSALDSLVLNQGNNILNSLSLEKFKKSIGSKAFIIEVNYYHGYPKSEPFKT